MSEKMNIQFFKNKKIKLFIFWAAYIAEISKLLLHKIYSIITFLSLLLL